MTTQTVQFESVSISEIGSGAITGFLYSGATLIATLASITENGTLKGRYTGTVTDIDAGTYRLVIKFNGITISDPDIRVRLVLAVGTYKAFSLLDKVEAVAAGTLTGAGTDPEVFTGTNVTVSVSATEDGNRTAVVVS